MPFDFSQVKDPKFLEVVKKTPHLLRYLENYSAQLLSSSPQNANDANADIDGDQYILWGLDNNCGGGVDDWNLVLYAKWRHDNP